MYAARRTYVKQWDHQPARERYSVKVTRGGKPVTGIQPESISFVEEEVMYWRKANHIHGWFVANVQNGEDDCGRYEISTNQLRQLLDTCERVIESSRLVDGQVHAGTEWNAEHPNGRQIYEPGKVIEDPTVARELLPTQEGFFFGSQQYDERYLEDVVATCDWVRRMLDDEERGAPGYFVYSSSW